MWIGKRVLEDAIFGISTYLLENFNANYLHYVIRVDGQNWHLCQVSGSVKKGKRFSGADTNVHVGRCTEPDDKFEWFYKGKTNYPIRDIVNFIN